MQRETEFFLFTYRQHRSSPSRGCRRRGRATPNWTPIQRGTLMREQNNLRHENTLATRSAGRPGTPTRSIVSGDGEHHRRGHPGLRNILNSLGRSSREGLSRKSSRFAHGGPGDLLDETATGLPMMAQKHVQTETGRLAREPQRHRYHPVRAARACNAGDLIGGSRRREARRRRAGAWRPLRRQRS